MSHFQAYHNDLGNIFYTTIRRPLMCRSSHKPSFLLVFVITDKLPPPSSKPLDMTESFPVKGNDLLLKLKGPPWMLVTIWCDKLTISYSLICRLNSPFISQTWLFSIIPCKPYYMLPGMIECISSMRVESSMGWINITSGASIVWWTWGIHENQSTAI